MEITAKQLGQTTVVSIVGSVDALTANQVTSFLSAQVGNGQRQLVADLSQVDFMSSAGLRAILIALKESRQQGGDLRLAAAQPRVENILKIAGLTGVLQAFPTLDQAIASFGS
jgi:anti-anti-sigma factor